jgi:hypothetical protein
MECPCKDLSKIVGEQTKNAVAWRWAAFTNMKNMRTENEKCHLHRVIFIEGNQQQE